MGSRSVPASRIRSHISEREINPQRAVGSVISRIFMKLVSQLSVLTGGLPTVFMENGVLDRDECSAIGE